MGVILRSMFFDDDDYYADDFVESNKNTYSDGILPNTEYLKVQPVNGLSLAVTSGRGWCQGHNFYNVSTAVVTLAHADGVLNRIDRVVVRIDYTTTQRKQFILEVLTGVLSATPVAPALTRNGTYYELCIAEISITHGTTTITTGMITDKRSDPILCGWAGAFSSQQFTFDDKADKTTTADLQTQINTIKANDVTDTANLTALAEKVYGFSPYSNKTTFASSGSWVCPAGVKKVAIWIQNGGNGSGGAEAYGDAKNDYYAVAAHGASGAMSIMHNINVTPGQSYPIVIGAGGAGGTIPVSPDWQGTFNTTYGGSGGVSTAFGYNGSSAILGQYTNVNDILAYQLSGNISQAGAPIFVGTNANKYENTLQLAVLNNGGATNWVRSEVNGNKVQLPGSAGTAGKIIIYY